jgi:hypothetical protein
MSKHNRSLFILLFTFPLAFSLTTSFYSQTDSIQKKWSIGINVGELIPTYDFSNQYDISFLLGLKAEYNIKPYFSIYLSSAYNFLKPNYEGAYIPGDIPQINAKCITTTIGIKYHPMESFSGLFTQLGVGHYYLEWRYLNLWDNSRYSDISNNLGFNFGLGYEFSILKYFKMEFGGDYNYINTKGIKITTCLVLYAGTSFKL